MSRYLKGKQHFEVFLATESQLNAVLVKVKVREEFPFDGQP